MYLHLGCDVIVNEKDVIGVFDIENTSVSKITKQFLSNAEKTSDIINVSLEMPKSYIICEKNKKKTIYISQISPATLRKRANIVFDSPI